MLDPHFAAACGGIPSPVTYPSRLLSGPLAFLLLTCLQAHTLRVLCFQRKASFVNIVVCCGCYCNLKPGR